MWWWIFKSSSAQPTQEVDTFEELKNRKQFVNKTCEKLQGLKDENETNTDTDKEVNVKLVELKQRNIQLNRTCDQLAALKKESKIKSLDCTVNTVSKNNTNNDNEANTSTLKTCGNNEENIVAENRKNVINGENNLCTENGKERDIVINELDKCIKEEILKIVSLLEDKLQTVCTQVFRFML